ncbi:MAG TPA: Fe-S cluster assembly protein SufD [Vicinamibacterales bacterium]|nr:Fe-S cluster assembly protein SufD [Vicinamibacterales bacterium]
MKTAPGAVAERNDFYLTEHDRFLHERGASAPWLRELRGRALTRFAEMGFPTTRDEEWRFTNVGPIAETPFRLAGVPADGAAAPGLVGGVAFGSVAARLVVVNGRFAADLSTVSVESRVNAGGLAAAIAKDIPEVGDDRLATLRFDGRPFVALNTAFLDDGAFISIPAGVVVPDPIHIIIVTAPGADPAVAHPRIAVVAGANSQATIVETYIGVPGTPYLTNAVTEVVLGDRAVVEHYKDQREPVTAHHIATMQVRLGRSSTFTSQSFAFGGHIVRNDILAVLAGEGGECTLNGLYFSDDRRLVDTHTTIDHALPHCASHELYKGIVAGKARAIFNGKIIVRQDAQKTDAKQTNRALLLSDGAQINTKPQLEIFADDVKCTHGAAIGQLDDEAMFYLRARGLTAVEARDLLIHAFAGEILNRVKVESLRTQMESALFEQLARDLEDRA